jgi:hypothetical protein
VNDGLVVIGAKPVGPHGLNADKEEFRAIVATLWGDGDSGAIRNRSVEDVLTELGISKDFHFTSKSGDAPLTWIHRKIGNDDVYFVANQRRSTEEVVIDLRGANRSVELWDPVTGTVKKVGSFNTLSVPLVLHDYGSMFVVLRESTTVRVASPAHYKVTRQLYAEVKNSFSISFWAKPESSVMLSTNNFMDGQKPWTDYYTIYPSPGEKLYGEGHSTCGIVVGRNGVAVWEHAKERPVFSFAAPKDLSSWTHVVLTYNDGTPLVFINGELLAQGPKSNFIVHPGAGHVYLSEGASFYNGDMTKPEVHNTPLSPGSLKPIASQRPTRLDAHGVTAITSKWTIAFPEKHGAPPTVRLDHLVPLNEHPESGVKYFSGTCTYSTSFSFRSVKKVAANERIFLDLGSVEVIAEVLLNGKSLGVIWTRPYKIDVTDTLINGTNDLVIKVTTLWPNRLIGDEQVKDAYQYSPPGGAGFAALSSGGIIELPEWYRNNQPKPDDGRVAFTTWKHYQKNSPLLQSGLIGPVIVTYGS